ncbi:MAG: hypothetical protein IPQ13_14005 [Holophagaceae bacterium]|nr:hypothetical protein [Holophagaceae bacterium]
MTATYFSGNTAPIITSTSIPGVPQNHGIPVNSSVPPYQFSASDTAGDPLTWSLVSAPAGFSLTSGGVLTWSSNFATGSDFAVRTITVKVTDAGGLSDTKTLQINIVSDTKPNFTTQTYTETVTNVQFHDPSNLRQKITGYSFFNFLDTNAADREYYADPSSSIKGWRAGVTATDAENDVVVYSVKTNSVFRFGSPYVATTDSNASPAGGRYPYVVPGPTADTSGTGVVRNPGEIVWRPGRNLGNPGTNGAVLNTGINTDALTGSVDGTPTHDPANWSFTVVAQQLIGTTATPGQFNETTLTIKVQPNHQPYIGALTTINVPAITAGVNVGAGTAVVPNVGRPAIQEPVASDTSTPGTPSKWIWAINTPGAASSDTTIGDPNTNGFHGHQDAIQVFFGSAPYNTVNGIGVLTVGNYPTFDTTGNYPAVLTSGTIPNGFYNPWLGAVPSPATYTVAWAPIRIQYQLGRYLYCFTGTPNAYNFPLKVEDQYTLSNTAAVNIFPIFGTVKFFNSRFRFRLDDGSDESWAFPRGFYNTAGNFFSAYSAVSGAPPRYTFNYLPIGVSSASGSAEILTSSGTSTYGSNLFGRANPSVLGAAASGYGSYGGGYLAPGQWGGTAQLTAGNWHTLDGLNVNGDEVNAFLSPGNPLNTLFNPASHAAGIPGTGGGTTATYTQFKGSAAAPISIALDGSPYTNNEADARVIPSNSPYLFNASGLGLPYGGYGAIAPYFDGYLWGNNVRYPDLPAQGGVDGYLATGFFGNYYLGRAYAYPIQWAAGCAQSEVNYQQVLGGRAVYFSDTWSNFNFFPDVDDTSVNTPGWNPDARLRLSFTWPTLVTNSAAGYPVSGSANTWGTTDVMQVATPNMGGRSRFFFTGNYVGTSESDPLNYWKLGYAQSTGLNFTSNGAIDAISQPIHVVTNSLWLPAEAAGHFNLLNTLTTPAGGSGYTDLPFTGIRGYVHPNISVWPFFAPFTAYSAGTPYGQNAIIPDANVWAANYQDTFSALAVDWHVGNLTQTAYVDDNNVNPALIETGSGDNAFFLWMKQDPTILDAYGTYAGSYLSGGVSTTLAVGGHTAAPDFWMDYGLTDTQSQVSFSEIGTQLGGVNQAINSGIGMTGWNITQFEQLRSLAAAPAQYGNAPRARLVDPAHNATALGYASDNRIETFDTATAPTYDGIVSNSLIVYAIQNRGTDAYGNSLLGEAGIEPGAPVLAQWWNNLTHTDAAVADFPEVLLNYTSSFLPSGYQEVVELKHNYIGKLMYPQVSPAGTPIQKVVLSAGIIAPKGDALLNNAIPVVTPVRQLAINDMKINTATGTTAIGTKLDIFNGTADLSANGLAFGSPLGGIPSYKLTDGNSRGSDNRLHGDSNIQITWQPGVNDLRNPSGYEVTLYTPNLFQNPGLGWIAIQKVRVPHKGGIGAIQTLNLPSFRAMDTMDAWTPVAPYSFTYAVKVRNIWMNGNEGPDSKGFDMAKEPNASRFPMAWADCLSGVFVVDFGPGNPLYPKVGPSGTNAAGLASGATGPTGPRFSDRHIGGGPIGASGGQTDLRQKKMTPSRRPVAASITGPTGGQSSDRHIGGGGPVGGGGFGEGRR